MARPIAYDRLNVLDRALGAFWRLGYDGCSISDLTAACGINRQSLYALFTDKHGAFCAALARYSDLLDLALAPLAAPTAALPDLRSFMVNALALQAQMQSGACLLVITAFSPQIENNRIREAVEQGAMRTRMAFETVLAKQGVADPNSAAAYLYSVMTGLSALTRTGGTQAHIDATLDFTFSSLATRKIP
jgi:AcrR family transcriptional regulator